VATQEDSKKRCKVRIQMLSIQNYRETSARCK